MGLGFDVPLSRVACAVVAGYVSGVGGDDAILIFPLMDIYRE